MSWFNQLISWFRPTQDQDAKSGMGFDAGKGAKKSGGARSQLAAEQMELADEIERLFMAYDEKVRDVALRVRDLPPDVAEEEVSRLQEVQNDLKLVVRRLDAAIKSRQELEQELSSWRNRGQNKEEVRRRTEIIMSELAVRGIGNLEEPETIPQIKADDLVKDRPKGNFLAGAEKEIEWQPSIEAGEEGEPVVLQSLDVENLLAAIREATREAERWHAIPVEDHAEDALLQVKHVRQLNGLLKRLDRKNGIVRDRLEIAICPREYR